MGAVRSTPYSPSMFETFALSLHDRQAAADPGLVRLTLALRGTLSVFLTTTVALIAAHFGGWSIAEFASGIVLSMMGPFLMREPTLRQRRRTLLTLLLPAILSDVATTLLHGHGPLGDMSFLVLVFLCYLFQQRSPRMTAIGLVAVVTSYVGLYLELPPATLPIQVAAQVLAIPIIALACFVLLPMNHAATLRRMVVAVQGRAAAVLRHAGEAGADDPPPAALARLRRDLTRLNEAALAADDQLALVQPMDRTAVRTGLIDLELATARLIEALRREAPGPRHATRLLLHERRMRRGRPYAMSSEMIEPGSLRAHLVDLGHAIHGLGVAAQSIAVGAEGPPGVPPPPGPLAWRMATRVTLAAALAMAGGMALSPQRWFWAVITVYVVFLNARSRGDTILKGLQRLGGTLIGIFSGLALATVLTGDPWMESAAMLLSVFGMFYFFVVSYTAGIFFVTVLLGMVYGLLGAPPEQLLVLRFEETMIGASAAILVAAFVFPVRTREQVRNSGRAVLSALAAAVRCSRLAMAGTPDGSPVEAMRRVDRQVADLRLALAPLTAGRALLRRSALERPVPALLDCVHWARVLCAAAQTPGTADVVLAAQTAAIETRLTELAAAPPPAPTPTTVVAAPGPDGGAVQAALTRLDAAVAVLSERIEISALQGFALDA